LNYRASRSTQSTLVSDATIESGFTITVFGIIISNTTNQSAEIVFKDSSGTLDFTIVCRACDSKISHIEFVADGGLKVSGVGNAGVKVAVFHSSGGS
jgi:hypothetical protein